MVLGIAGGALGALGGEVAVTEELPLPGARNFVDSTTDNCNCPRNPLIEAGNSRFNEVVHAGLANCRLGALDRNSYEPKPITVLVNAGNRTSHPSLAAAVQLRSPSQMRISTTIADPLRNPYSRCGVLYWQVPVFR
jgi:hypothetical protein